MLIFLKIPHENGIILSQRVVQANHMNSLCIRHCRSWSYIINKEISLNKIIIVDIVSFFLMGLLCGTHIGSIRATLIWDNPYGTQAEPGCTPHMDSPYKNHTYMFAGR